MTESEAHKELKKLANIVLFDKGYKASEISEEYVVKLPPNSKKTRFVVDIVGINKEKRIAIELGTTTPQKLTQLELFFDEVIHIPYGVKRCEKINIDQVLQLKNEKDRLLDTIEELEKTITRQTNKISSHERRTEWSNTVEETLEIIKAIRVGLIRGRDPRTALAISQEQYTHTWAEQSEKHELMKNIFKVLLRLDDDFY